MWDTGLDGSENVVSKKHGKIIMMIITVGYSKKFDCRDRIEGLFGNLKVNVVVNFLSQVIFVFLLFLGLVIYANEVETKEK